MFEGAFGEDRKNGGKIRDFGGVSGIYKREQRGYYF